MTRTLVLSALTNLALMALVASQDAPTTSSPVDGVTLDAEGYEAVAARVAGKLGFPRIEGVACVQRGEVARCMLRLHEQAQHAVTGETVVLTLEWSCSAEGCWSAE